jgi:pimeloyl-ACP methyl ester carboxylesterase
MGAAMEISEFASHCRTTDTEQGQIGYVDVGDGPAAIFVHGIFLNSYLWRPTIGKLSDERRCVAIDLPAHGETKLEGVELSFATQVETVRALADNLGLERFDLVGNDTGGAVCQAVAAKFPERIRTLTLTNCDAHDNFPPEAFNDGVEAARRGDLAPLMVEMSKSPELARGEEFGFGRALEYPEALSDKELAVFTGQFADLEHARLVEELTVNIDAADLLAIEPDLQRLEAPTLIVWGTGDVFFGLDWAYWLRDNIPGADTVVELKGAKLFFPLERSQEFIEHVRRHWQAHAPVTAASSA